MRDLSEQKLVWEHLIKVRDVIVKSVLPSIILRFDSEIKSSVKRTCKTLRLCKYLMRYFPKYLRKKNF